MGSLGHIERVFLGCGRPALHAAADWLVDGLGRSEAGLGDVLIAVPGGRAMRRLEELLAQRSMGRALVPPKIVTVGGLADHLLPSDCKPVAGRLTSMLAWASVLREADKALIAAVIPEAPRRDDWPAWWALAEQVMQAADELGGHRLTVADVVERSTHPGDLSRWAALSELAERYEDQLAEQGLVDRHRARLDAIASASCSCDQRVVLLGLADLSPVLSAMLSCLETCVYALIAAEASDAAGFDALGGFAEPYWSRRPIDIDDESIVVCDRPADQAAAVLEVVRGWAEAVPTSADAITVGLGDAKLAGPIERTLSFAGLPVRSAAGRSVGGSRPVQLLKAIAGFANGLRFDTLAALLRHPDCEAWVAQRTGQSTRSWLMVLDEYATDHLAARPIGGWLGKQAESMKQVYDAARSLIPEQVGVLRPLNGWAEPIAQVLREVYGELTLQRYDESDRPLVIALEQITLALKDLLKIGPSLVPHCSFAQAVTLVVDQVAGQSIPEPGGEPAIELVGYLELLLDDAPYLVITGMNEQHVPEPPRVSALLPEGVRRSVGLADDAHRLARDGYALSTMLASRGRMKLVVVKRSVDGDPLMLSRLLLKADDQTLVQRVSDFTAEHVENTRPIPTLLLPGKHDRFLMPMPVLMDEPIGSLRVTAFRDYLSCPYRFYLKHVLKLRTLDDRAVEVSARGFGVLAHEALRTLAQDDLRTVTDHALIADRLSSALDAAFKRHYGSEPPVAAKIQCEQLRYRLEKFAPQHARAVSEGWRIEHEEKTREVDVMVDGQPFTIRGQIDRIDKHPEHGWRLIDYKTSDSGKSPAKTHRKKVDGVDRWVDLQLPLYLDLAAGLGVDRGAQLGYINLPKKVREKGFGTFDRADWDAGLLREADDQRDFVIRQVRAGVYWPPKQPPVFDDGLRRLCGDEVADRMALIAASQGGDA